MAPVALVLLPFLPMLRIGFFCHWAIQASVCVVRLVPTEYVLVSLQLDLILETHVPNASRILLIPPEATHIIAFYIVSQDNCYPEALALLPSPNNVFTSTGMFRMLPIRPQLTPLICWIVGINWHSWGSRTKTELLTHFKWKLRFFRLRALPQSLTPYHIIKVEWGDLSIT